MITEASIRNIRENVNLEAVFAGRVEFTFDANGAASALCAWHDDHRPSMRVSPEGLLYCFACGKGGTVFSLVQEVYGYSFTRAVEYAAAQSGLTVEYDSPDATRVPADVIDRVYAINEAAARFFTENLMLPEAKPARDLLEGRNFPVADSVEVFGVGYALNDFQSLRRYLLDAGFTDEDIVAAGVAKRNEEKDSTYDRFRGRLVWPIRDTAGRVIGFGGRTVIGDSAKFLNPTDTPVYRKTDAYYGVDLAIDAIRENGSVVIVEGYMDVMACHAAGIHNAIAVNGTAFGPGHASALRRLVAPKGTWGKVTLGFDGDAAGQKAAQRAFGALSSAGVTKVTTMVYPIGMDACDLWLEGVDRLQDAYASRREFLDQLMDSLLDGADVYQRSEVLATVRPLVAAIADPVLSRFWVNRVAARFNVKPSDVQSGSMTSRPKTTVNAPDGDMAEWRLVCLKVQHPGVVSVDLDLVTSDVFRAVLDGTSEDEALVARAKLEQLPCPSGQEAEYADVLASHLRGVRLGEQIAEVKRELLANPESDGLREQFAALTRERATLLRR